MSRLLAAVFSDLESHSVQWSRMPSERMVQLVSEYRHLAEWMASQHGCLHRNFVGDGHLFLFENPDAAIQFGFRLIQGWHGGEPFAVATGLPALPLRVGCHFGECVALESDAWDRAWHHACEARRDRRSPQCTLCDGKRPLDH